MMAAPALNGCNLIIALGLSTVQHSPKSLPLPLGYPPPVALCDEAASPLSAVEGRDRSHPSSHRDARRRQHKSSGFVDLAPVRLLPFGVQSGQYRAGQSLRGR